MSSPKPAARATPLQALTLVTLIYLGASAIIATSRRYGFGDQSRLIADLFYVLCASLIVDRNAISSAAVRSAGIGGAATSLAVGLSSGLTAVCIVLWRASQQGTLESDPMPTAEILHAVIAAPVTEEMLFTGFLYVALRARLRLTYALLVVALVFTIGHLPGNWLSFGIRFIYMSVSCLLFERYRALALNMTAHGLMNGVLILVGQLPFVYQPVLLYGSSSLPFVALISGMSMLLLVLVLLRPGSFGCDPDPLQARL